MPEPTAFSSDHPEVGVMWHIWQLANDAFDAQLRAICERYPGFVTMVRGRYETKLIGLRGMDLKSSEAPRCPLPPDVQRDVGAAAHHEGGQGAAR